jgi:hypothetical protein
MNTNLNLNSTAAAPRWMFWCLLLAGVYNLLWGAWVILFPNMLFDALAMERPNYPQIWQCVGMIVGVYGVGYIIAGCDPYRHWPIVLVGFLGKILGPIGMIEQIATGALPLKFGVTCITNDLVWWVPFFLILLGAYRHHRQATYNKKPAD